MGTREQCGRSRRRPLRHVVGHVGLGGGLAYGEELHPCLVSLGRISLPVVIANLVSGLYPPHSAPIESLSMASGRAFQRMFVRDQTNVTHFGPRFIQKSEKRKAILVNVRTKSDTQEQGPRNQ